MKAGKARKKQFSRKKIEDAPAKYLNDSVMEYLDHHHQQAGGGEHPAGWRRQQGWPQGRMMKLE